MQQNERKPSRTPSPRGKCPSGRTSEWPCKDYLGKLAITHFLKNCTLQNACSTRPRVVVGLGKTALSHIVWFDTQPTKWSKSNNDKSAVALLKKGDCRESELVIDEYHNRLWKSGKRSDQKLGQNPSKRQYSDARQLGCVFQDMTLLKSILRKCTDMPKPIQRVKFTKAIANHTKIRDQNPSLGRICPVNLISVAPTLQNLRIGLRRRQSGKNKVSAKQRGSWPKMCSN